MRSSVMPSLFSSVSSMQPILVSTGSPVSKGYRPDMFYVILVQRCHMPHHRTPCLRSPEVSSDEQQRGALPAFERSRWRQSTTTDITTYYRVGWMCLFPFRRLAMYYLEHPGPHWICSLQAKEQSVETQLSQKTFGPQQHHLSAGNVWKGRVALSCLGTGSAISALWYKCS